MKHQDLSQGKDNRGDKAIFIEEKHFNVEPNGQCWNLKPESSKLLQKFGENELVYFVVIRDGVQQNGHGWIETKEGDITQWG